MNSFFKPTEKLEELIDNYQEFIDEELVNESSLSGSFIIELTNKILIKSIQERAYFIHIEPLKDSLRVRFRIDDVLHQPFRLFPKEIISSLILRFKIIANLDTTESKMAQEGIIRRIYQGSQVNFLVNTLPTYYGEKIVLRRWDRSHVDLDLDRLIIDHSTLKLVKEMICRPWGLILVTGPGRCGMTTTLYSLIAQLNKPDINICTVNDQFEYILPGITQMQVNRDKYISFASAIEAFMKQDPDVILVDETRSMKIAKTAIEAAERCLVVTGIHANDAPSVISRLDEMGIERFMIYHVIIGVIAQRLLRRVCPDCAIPYSPTTAELLYFGVSTSKDEIIIYKANTRKERLSFNAAGNLCHNCHGIGYKGFVGVYQVMPVTNQIKTLISQDTTSKKIRELAEAEGMKNMLDYSLDLVWKKHTTLEEIHRRIYD